MIPKYAYRCLLFSVIVIFFLINSQSSFSQVIDTDDGKIEFIGLKKWTIQMIKDKMTELAPGEPLRACAQVLKNVLSFPEVAVMFYPNDNGYSVITVVEPHLSERIQYRNKNEFPEIMKTIESWREIKKMHDDWMNFGPAMRSYYFWEHNMTETAQQIITDAEADRKKCERIWRYFSSKKTVGVKESVFRTLKFDANPENRLAAVALLVNFTDDDFAWYSLVEAFLDPEPEIRTMALSVAWIFNEYHTRTIEWGPAIASLHRILKGTNLNGFYFILKILARTKIPPKYAPDLLNDGGVDYVLSYLRAEHTTEKEMAHTLLVQLSGKDHGYDVSKWRKWIEMISR